MVISLLDTSSFTNYPSIDRRVEIGAPSFPLMPRFPSSYSPLSGTGVPHALEDPTPSEG
jgi:hypothetical protein